MITAAVADHVELMAEHGETIPEPLNVAVEVEVEVEVTVPALDPAQQAGGEVKVPTLNTPQQAAVESGG